jgi:hypothetical protein
MAGVVFYEGPSQIDDKPIVAIATDGSSNRKTGDMIQTWILRSRIDPVQAAKAGDDISICGDCPHRSGKVRTCYVQVGQAPLSVYRAYRRKVYPKGKLEDFAQGRKIRAGSYGDPVAVPWQAWCRASIWSGYTHQWVEDFAQSFKEVLMASCETPKDLELAQRWGWRTFLTRKVGDTASLEGSIECLATAHGKQCISCGLCSGLQRPKAPHIWIEAHGAAKKSYGQRAPAVPV